MNTLMESGVQLTLEQWMPQIFQKLTVGVSERPAKTSPLPVNEKGLKETDQVLLEKYSEFLPKRGKKINLNGLSMKMLRECYRATEDLISLGYSLNLIGGGYDTEWQLLNTKCHGIPQNRERVYVIGHLRSKGSRKIFPLRGTDSKTYIPIKQIAQLKSNHRDNPSAYRVYDTSGIAPTLNTGGGVEENLISLRIKEATKKGYAIAYPGDSINLSLPNSKTRRGRVGRKVANTLDTACNIGTIDGKRVRKITPRECFRLQGWNDEYFERAQFVNSDAQLYKQAGNGVSVNVVQTIAEILHE